MTIVAGTVALNIIYEGFLVKNHTPSTTKMPKIYTLIMNKMAETHTL